MEEVQVVSVLGGAKVLGKITTSIEMDDKIRHGLPVHALLAFKAHTGWTNKEVANVLHVSTKTVERAVAGGGRISPVASNQLYRAARTVALAEVVLEDPGHAREWLHGPQPGLGGRRPIDLLSTDAGAREVEDLLHRIEYGFTA
jgi:putative toxin-antitoxin system antitoxin component (TIGR02293 family)